ncbi:hypothetical protein PFHG_05002 [Plasmodium falciparum HB3]|uniref:Uncharacterized protein n=12 Tax=Plasmodium falciparum TaxID=5833 RepID=Q8IJB8_PLAF7|nr:conserved Plasmodium protein, unknown function [Plasmodium falciparum 3D7]KAF4328042.1 hypothetical protein CYL21_3780 [Plasmodium falciparum NF54]KOB63234.1 hypothetical protein PFHG_05002 [Plasmodium falciparum HB3]SOS78939.1 conserved Plasmodium protein, unknown function [Plasmodium sp. gorilla clade G1]PKC43491.1 hypothetical protein CK202_4710 [Plasmodium falciparum NF54]CZT98541.1 conserved Plasmodium protein, unknown function [Plasmodium falciparum 3D7]|eukprot:XP_001347564.1 conserved Plasmodium protein, unknown function [Plasmodium falciparum 3D7]
MENLNNDNVNANTDISNKNNCEEKSDELKNNVEVFNIAEGEECNLKNDDEHVSQQGEESSYMSEMKKKSLLAEHIAKEAKKKASVIIMKNERLQKVYKGRGVNDNENISENTEKMVEGNEIKTPIIQSEMDNNDQENSTQNEPKKKFLIGAKPILPTCNEELLEKLKQRRV